MIFSYTYRSAKGMVESATLEAASRADCLAQLKAKGISPMSVKEGASRPSSSRSSFPVKGIVALVVVLLVVVGAWFVFFGKPDKPVEPEKIVKEKPHGALKEQAPVPRKPKAAPPKVKMFKPVHSQKLTADVKAPEVRQDMLMAKYHAINPRMVRDHQLFKHNSDIMMCDIITAQPGEYVIDMEMDKNFDENFVKSLADPIAAHEKDSEDDKAIKDAVRKMRKTLAGLIADGESPAVAIKQARDDLNKIAEYRESLETGLREAAQTENIEYLEQYVKEANEMLGEYGAFPIKLGKKLRARVEERLAAEGVNGGTAVSKSGTAGNDTAAKEEVSSKDNDVEKKAEKVQEEKE